MKEIYVKGIVQDYDKSINSINKYLFSENERLNAIIDELEERIDKLNEILYDDNLCHVEKLQEIHKILGDKENE